MPTQVQTSPQPSSFFSAFTFFAFAPTKHQISSHCIRRTLRFRTARLWYAAQAQPRSVSNLTIVFLATPVILDVERIEQPSTKQLTTRERVLVSRQFILTFIPF